MSSAHVVHIAVNGRDCCRGKTRHSGRKADARAKERSSFTPRVQLHCSEVCSLCVCTCGGVVGGCLSVGREGVGNGIKVSAVQSKHTFLQ